MQTYLHVAHEVFDERYHRNNLGKEIGVDPPLFKSIGSMNIYMVVLLVGPYMERNHRESLPFLGFFLIIGGNYSLSVNYLMKFPYGNCGLK